MKTKLFISLLFAITITCKLFAANGSQCTSAIPVLVGDHPIVQNYYISGNAMWFSFVADASNMTIVTDKANNPPFGASSAKIQQLSLYSGTCNHLTLVAENHIHSAASDTFPYLNMGTLIAGHTYYIQVSPFASLSNGFFSLIVKKAPRLTATASAACNIATCGNNLLVNADFENATFSGGAYSGFFSAYKENLNPDVPDDIFITNDAQNNNGAWTNKPAESGNYFLACDGAGSTNPNTILWQETVPVCPHTDYVFSMWGIDLTQGTVPNAPAQITCSINAVMVGSTFTVNTAWTQDCRTWNSGTATTATITLVDVTGVGTGNDFGLDNLSFLQADPFATSTMTITSTSGTLCSGQSTTLTLTGAPANSTFMWSTGGTANTITVSPAMTSTYTVTVTDCSCSSTLATTVTVNPTPTVTIAGNTNVCGSPTTTLTAMPAASQYHWSNGSTKQSIVVNTSNQYSVTVTSTFGCTANATVTVTINQIPAVTASANPTFVCPVNPTATLTASGGVSYQWSNGATGSPIDVVPHATTTYVVTATGAGGCTNTASVVVTYSPICPCSNCTSIMPATITAGTYTGSNCIESNTTISGNVTFLSGEFRIASNVTIHVPSGATFNIIGSHLYACNDMWQGIVVDNGGILNITNSPSTTIRIPFFPPIVIPGHTAFIEDAIGAVFLSDGPTGSSINWQCSVSDAIFNKNGNSIVASSYNNYPPSSGTTYPLTVNNAVFTCRNIPFTAGVPLFNSWPTAATLKTTTAQSNPMISPYLVGGYAPTTLKANGSGFSYAQDGIAIDGLGAKSGSTYYTTNIGQQAGGNALNLFDNLESGIYVGNSSLNIYNNVFQNSRNSTDGTTSFSWGVREICNDCQLNISGNGSGAYINTFYNCFRGAQTSTGAGSENISECAMYTTQDISMEGTFYHVGNAGIFTEISSGANLTISKNKIYNIEIGIIYDPSPGVYTNQTHAISNNLVAAVPPATTQTNQFVATALEYLDTYLVPATINSNSFTNVYNGMTISFNNFNGSAKTITNNVISMVNDAQTGNMQSGIYSDPQSIGPVTTTSYQINNNTISYSGSGTANTNMAALYSLIGFNLRVANNISTNTPMGFCFADFNYATRFACNSMAGHSSGGFVLNYNGIIGQQPYGYTPKGGELAAQNQWSGSGATANTINGSSAQQSKMYVQSPGTASAYNPVGAGSKTSGTKGFDDYFYKQVLRNGLLVTDSLSTVLPDTAGTINCITQANLRVAGGGGSVDGTGQSDSRNNVHLLEQIALDQVPFHVYTQETQFMDKHRLYNILMADSQLVDSSAILRTFRNTASTQCIGKLHDLSVALANDQYAQAIAIANGLDLQHPTEAAYKTYTHIYVDYQLALAAWRTHHQGHMPIPGRDTCLLGKNDSTQLVTLASSCPFTDGAAVPAARSLYKRAYHQFNAFRDNCPVIPPTMNTADESRKGELTITANDVLNVKFDAVVYPNPSIDGQVQVAPTGIMSGSLYITVIDVAGKIIYKGLTAVEDGKASLKLNAGNGVYSVQITNTTTHESINKKLVITR